MASPYYTEPANILPGLQMLGEGLNRRAELARQRAAAAEEAENIKLAEEALKSGDPDMVDRAMLKNPKLAPLIQQRMGIKEGQDLSKETDSILRILSETDPTAKTEIILDEATKAHEAGEPYKHFLDMGYMATSGKHADVDKKLLLILAASNPEVYKAYKEQAGIGKEKKLNISQERADFERATEEGSFKGTWPEYMKMVAGLKRQKRIVPFGEGQMIDPDTMEKYKVPVKKSDNGAGRGQAYNASKVYAVTDTVTGKRLYKSGAVLLNDTEGRFTPLTGDVNLSQEKSEARMRGGARAAAIDTANNLYQENAPKLVELRRRVEQKKLLPSGGLKSINQYQNWVGKHTSDPDVAELTGKATLIAENLQRTVGGGVGEWTFRITKDLLDPALSPEAFERRIKSHAGDISKMAESSRGFGKQGVSKPFYEEKEKPKGNVVIKNHSKMGDITEEDIRLTMRKHKMTRQQVLERLGK